MAGAVSNIAQPYHHILFLQKENNNLKIELGLKRQKLEIATEHKRNESRVIVSEGADENLKQLYVANKRIQGLKLDIEELTFAMKKNPGGSSQKENVTTQLFLADQLSHWPYQDKLVGEGREDFIRNEMLKLEKEIRRRYDAGIIGNTEFTKELFKIIN